MSLAPMSVRAAEIHSNGFGGGDWSDPGSWREKVVPSAKDDVVVSRGDIIVFDRNHEGQQTCMQIFIDPQGVLSFKPGQGRVICSVAAPIESYGAIKLDGSQSANDHFELRMVGATFDDRAIRLLKGATLVLNGNRESRNGKHNVAIDASPDQPKTPPSAAADQANKDGKPAAGPEKAEAYGTIFAGAGVTVDFQRADVMNTHLSIADIDNTGARVNERLNLSDSHFAGLSHLSLKNCDSPAIVNNLFELVGAPGFKSPAVTMTECPLAEIRGNTIRGPYPFGFQGKQLVDSALTNATFEGCVEGVHWNGTNAMIRGLSIRDCDKGITLSTSTGVLEDAKIANCKTACINVASTVQWTNVDVTDVPKDGVVVSFLSGSMALLNCNIQPEQVVVSPDAAKGKTDNSPLLEWLYYLVVAPKGTVPAEAMVEVTTAGQPASPADPNVRNTPATVYRGLTPLPQTYQPLVVRGWTIDAAGKVSAMPQYDVNVILPAAKENEAPRILKSVRATPDNSWYRSKPDEAKATIEVPL